MKPNQEGYKNFPNRLIDQIVALPEENYFTPVIKDVFESIPKPEKVCDVGCGNGVYTICIKSLTDCELVGVDASSHALSKSLELGFDRLMLVEDFCNQRLPFDDKVFDLIICKDVLEHLYNPEFLVSEMSRVLKGGGYCLLHVPNHFPLIGRLRLLFFNTIDGFKYFPDEPRWSYPHIRFFDKSSIIELASLYQMSLESDLSWHFFSPSRLGKLLPFMARSIAKLSTDLFSEGITILFKKSKSEQMSL